MNIKQLLQGGISGLLLGLIVLFAGAVFTILTDKYLTGGTGVAGAAISSTAASAVAIPPAMVSVDASLKHMALSATPQIAAAVIVTSLLTPWLTAQVYKRQIARETKKPQ